MERRRPTILRDALIVTLAAPKTRHAGMLLQLLHVFAIHYVLCKCFAFRCWHSYCRSRLFRGLCSGELRCMTHHIWYLQAIGKSGLIYYNVLV